MPVVNIRVSDEVKEQLTRAALHNRRSLTAQVLFILDEYIRNNPMQPGNKAVQKPSKPAPVDPDDAVLDGFEFGDDDGA